MNYILVLIIVMTGGDFISIHAGNYNNMTSCFKARELVVEKQGKPIVNYQAICVPYDK